MFHTEDELKKYKISTYEHIPYVNDFTCPECGKATEFPSYAYHVKPSIYGWCETPQGFMQIVECPVCGQKFRFHGVIEKFDYEHFLQNFSLLLYMQEENKR